MALMVQYVELSIIVVGDEKRKHENEKVSDNYQGSKRVEPDLEK
jgi:hypothetical protein